MEWSNNEFAPDDMIKPTRLLIEVTNPADEAVTNYLDEQGLDIESDRLNAEKTTYFLRMVVSLVMIIGLIISILSFYILMLSIYLLVQEHKEVAEPHSYRLLHQQSCHALPDAYCWTEHDSTCDIHRRCCSSQRVLYGNSAKSVSGNRQRNHASLHITWHNTTAYRYDYQRDSHQKQDKTPINNLQ